MKYPHDHENDVIYFGRVNFRNSLKTFGIKTDDRRRHMYVIGKTGMGKTTLLENLFLSDVYAGHGCCYIDPHGDTAEKIIDHIPSWRINDVVYFNPADLDHPMGFNILESVDPKMKHLVAAGLMGVFKKIWEGVWSARMEYIMNNTILALLDTPGTTLLGINRMLSDEDYRTSIIKNIQDPIVKQFWLKEFANYQDKFASEAVAPIQNKVGQFISASIIRNIVAQAKSTLNIREIMDDQKIFVINLSKGRVGEDASRLLGGMLITKIQMSAMERVDLPEEERNDFYLYVDEFQNFAVESFASILSEARKYRLNLIMAHQYIAQLTEEVRDAVFGNVGSIISFRVGSPDAQFMEDEFMPRFTPEDIINLPKYNIYLKLMIDGVTSQPFSAATLPPIAHKTDSTQKVIEQSRQRYAKPREDIEQNVVKWSGFGDTVDVDEALSQAKKAKKEAKKAKYMHDYNCSSCDIKFQLPVELDRSRPIYCDDCHPKNKKTKKHNHGHDKNSIKKNNSEDKPKEKKVIENPPKITDGDLIEKEITDKELSLSQLKGEGSLESNQDKKHNNSRNKEQESSSHQGKKNNNRIDESNAEKHKESSHKKENPQVKDSSDKDSRPRPEKQDAGDKTEHGTNDVDSKLKPKTNDDISKKSDQKNIQESDQSSGRDSGKKRKRKRKRNRKKNKGDKTGSDNTSSTDDKTKDSNKKEGSESKIKSENKSGKLRPGEVVSFDE